MQFILFLGLLNASEFDHLTLSSSLASSSKCHQRPLSWAYASQFLQPSFSASPNVNSALILDVMSFSVVDRRHKASRKGWNVIKERRVILGAEYDIRLLTVVTNGCCLYICIDASRSATIYN